MSAWLFQRLMGPDGMSMVNGTTGVHGEEYWTDGATMSVSQVRPSSPQTQAQGQSQAQPQRQVSDVYSNTLPVRRPAPAKNKNPVGKISEHCENLLSITGTAARKSQAEYSYYTYIPIPIISRKAILRSILTSHKWLQSQ